MDHLEPVFRFIRHLPTLLWFASISLLQWFIPYSWYAKDVSEEVVLITGAGSGLGREIALNYAEQNSSLILWDINSDGLSETKRLVDQEHHKLRKDRDLFKRFCLTYNVDVSDREIVYASAKRVQKDLEQLERPSKRFVTVLVNNAGIYHGLMLQDLKDQQIERVFKINILAHFWTVRAFLPEMIKHEHGHIVEIASMGGQSGLMKQVDYCATKFATVGFEESLSMELYAMNLEDKIHTTVICPFFFQSNLFSGFDGKKALIMSVKYVASQTVWGMRCNHSKVLLPPSAYFLTLTRPVTPRRSMFLWSEILGLVDGIREVKGAASAAAAAAIN